MFSRCVSACVLALSLTSIAATSASAGNYDLRTLTSPLVYADVIDSDWRRPYPDFAKAEYPSDVTGENKSLIADVYPSKFVAALSPDPKTTSIAMLLAGLGLIITTARRRTAHR